MAAKIPKYVVGDIVQLVLTSNIDLRLPNLWKITKIEESKNAYHLASMQTYGLINIENKQNLDSYYKKAGYTKYSF